MWVSRVQGSTVDFIWFEVEAPPRIPMHLRAQNHKQPHRRRLHRQYMLGFRVQGPGPRVLGLGSRI